MVNRLIAGFDFWFTKRGIVSASSACPKSVRTPFPFRGNHID